MLVEKTGLQGNKNLKFVNTNEAGVYILRICWRGGGY